MIKALVMREESFIKRVILFPLELLSYIYRFAVLIRNFLYESGFAGRVKLGSTVISIGNLTTGGSGKTPMTIKLASLLDGEGKSVAVIAKGYGGKRKKDPFIVSDKNGVYGRVEEVSDEGVLLAEKLNRIPVIVGFRKNEAAALAHNLFKPDIIIIDDGFQHLKLHRDIDIVLIDYNNLDGKNYLLPRGLFREPVKNLSRGDFVIVVNCDDSNKGVALKLLKKVTDAEVFFARKNLKEVVCFEGDYVVDLSRFTGKKFFVFSSIADGEQFKEFLEKNGMEISKFRAYPDHYNYSESDIAEIAEEGRNADFFITTEKDVVKINKSALTNLMVAHITFDIDEEEKFLSRLKIKTGDGIAL